MKNHLLLLPLAALTLLLCSCFKDDSYRHNVAVIYPEHVGVLYADQTTDSVSFCTQDSYSVTAPSTDWITVLNKSDRPNAAKIENSYNVIYIVGVDFEATANTTKKCRLGYLNVRSYGVDDWDQTISAVYYQLAWHNVKYPSASYTYDADGNVIEAKFAATDTCIAYTDSLKFQAFDKWSISVPKGSFANVATLSGEAGDVSLPVTLAANESTEERSTTLTLKSDSGVETTVTYKQKGRVK